MDIEGQSYWFVEIPNQGQCPYFSYSESFYPNYTFTEKYIEDPYRFINDGTNYYYLADQIPYVSKSNLSSLYELIPEQYVIPKSIDSIIEDYYQSRQLQLENLQQQLDNLQLENTNLEQSNKDLQNTVTELEKENSTLKYQLESLQYTNTPENGLFIDIFRISPDGKYLEIDITCDVKYKFERFYIYDYQNKTEGKQIDILELIKEQFNHDQSRILSRISLDKLFGNTMYYADIEVELKEGDSAEEVIDSNKIYEVAASDISNVYFYLLPGLVQLGHPCDPCDLEIPIEIQRAFLIMWAHIEAMRLERWGEAEMFYTLIKNNFQNCLTEFEVKQKSCSCHAQKQSNFNFRR